MNQIIYSKKTGSLEEPEVKGDPEVERARVHSSMRVKSMEEMQKKFVENLIDIKLKKVMVKFDELEKRVEKLEKVILSLNHKIDSNLEKINRKEIKDKVEKLFDTLTPQFEKYFG
jgi:ribosomal protein L17